MQPCTRCPCWGRSCRCYIPGKPLGFLELLPSLQRAASLSALPLGQALPSEALGSILLRASPGTRHCHPWGLSSLAAREQIPEMGEAFPPPSESGLSDKSVRKQGFLLVVWCPGHFCGFRGRSQPTSTREFISTSLPSAAALGSVDLVLFCSQNPAHGCRSIFVPTPPFSYTAPHLFPTTLKCRFGIETRYLEK